MIESTQRLGWADAVNLGLHQSGGAVILLDTSLEPAGDFLAPARRLDDERVGVAGPWGVTSRDGRQFEDAPPGEVDAIEGYCLAIRRQALQQVGGFDHRFRFYRNADLDLSFAVRANGWKALRTEPAWNATIIAAGWHTRRPSAIGSASATSTASCTGAIGATCCCIRRHAPSAACHAEAA